MSWGAERAGREVTAIDVLRVDGGRRFPAGEDARPALHMCQLRRSRLTAPGKFI
jgi:hypothetical protein